MFKNPLKYQQGGTSPSQEEQKILAAFIEWLPKRVKEFQGMQPEQIAQALDGMSKTSEGKKQLQQLMMQFQQEMQGGSQAFRQGGKIHDFICKHAKGGKAGCGCKEDGGEIEIGKNGISRVEALRNAKEIHGYNNSQARFAYANVKNALREQGLHGRELRQRAREMISGGTKEPIAVIDPTSSIQGVAIATSPNGNPLPEQTIVGNRDPRMGNNYDNLTFSNAFRAARNKAGGDKGLFSWRGRKYTTELNSKKEKTNNEDHTSLDSTYEMPELEQVVIEDPETIIPENLLHTMDAFGPKIHNQNVYEVKSIPFIENISGMPEQIILSGPIMPYKRYFNNKIYYHGGKIAKAQKGTQFQAPTNYYNEKGWQISENDALRRNNRTFYTEEPTSAGNLAWTNNQMANQLIYPGIVQDVQYNQPVGHYIDEYGNIHDFAIEGDDLARYNNRKAQWKENGGKVTKAVDGSDGMPQAKNAKAARRAASKNTVSVGNSGRAKNRKIGAATDKFGGQHLYEDSVIDGSWSDVYVDVPHPGDTIVTQSFPVAGGNDTTTRTYPMGSKEYESVMSRMRPAFRMFFPQHKCGGKVKKAQEGMKQQRRILDTNNDIEHTWTRTIIPQDTTLTYGDGTYIQSWNSRRLPNGNLDRTTTVSYPDGELLEGPQEWSRSGNIQWKRQNQIFDRMLPQRDTLIIDNDAPPARKKGGIVK